MPQNGLVLRFRCTKFNISSQRSPGSETLTREGRRKGRALKERVSERGRDRGKSSGCSNEGVNWGVALLSLHVTVQKKSTQDRTIRAFVPAILLNLSLRHCDSTFLFRDLEVFGLTSR